MKSSVLSIAAPPVIVTPLRTRRWMTFGGLAIALISASILFLFNPTTHGFYPRCTLYTSTGWYCPGCGSLRALHQLSHGHLLAALHLNAVLVLGLPILGLYGASWLRDDVAGRPYRAKPWSLGLICTVLVLVGLFTILRNLPLAPFNWLAPVAS